MKGNGAVTRGGERSIGGGGTGGTGHVCFPGGNTVPGSVSLVIGMIEQREKNPLWVWNNLSSCHLVYKHGSCSAVSLVVVNVISFILEENVRVKGGDAWNFTHSHYMKTCLC